MTEKPRAANPGTSGAAPGGSAPADRQQASGGERVVIRDKRKLHEASGADSAAAPEASASSAEPAKATGSAKAAGSAKAPNAPPTGGAESAGAEQSGGADPAAGPAGPATSGSTPAPAGAEDVEVEIEAAVQEEQPPSEEQPTEPAQPAGAGSLSAELAAVRSELDERVRDLQRISAEYANYRKRVDRDRGVAAEQTTGMVLAALLPVLDDLDRAREHGDLVGPFATVADQLVAAMGKFGLNVFGEKGDPFNPTRHEAVAHLTSAEVSEPTCVEVMRRGYLLGERLLRPALVAVADPE